MLAAIIYPQLVDASPKKVITKPEARVRLAVSVTRVIVIEEIIPAPHKAVDCNGDHSRHGNGKYDLKHNL